MTPAAAKDLAVRGLLNGVNSLRWNGGSYAGVEILVSDAQTPGRITAVDATGLVVLLGDLELRSSGQALVEMVDSSSQTSGASVSAVRREHVSNKLALFACRAVDRREGNTRHGLGTFDGRATWWWLRQPDV